MPILLDEPEIGITLVTIANPAKRNALDEEAFRQLTALWPRLAASPTRCIVVRGAGDAFCSGADLSGGLGDLPDIEQLIEGALQKLETIGKPMVAAINGACVAGGLELALSCDIRLCASNAKLGLPEARWGIFPAGGAATRLAQEIGYCRAADLLLTGRLIDAQEAVDLGLVNRVIPEGGDVVEEAMAVARTIAGNSPKSVGAIKAYLSAARRPSAELTTLEASLARNVRRSSDAAEGAAAFLARRPPRYEGN